MGYLEGLKVITASKPVNLSPTLHRRNNLLNKLNQQFECARAKVDGSDYFVRSFKFVKRETGEREQVEWQRRIKPWWYSTHDGKVIFEVRYANKRIELMVENKGPGAEEFESKELKREKVIPEGQTVKITLGTLKKGKYKFFGDYQSETAQGKLVVE